MSETCSNKDCGCGKTHVYKDELSGLPVGEAHDRFDEKKEGLKKNIIELELKKRPFVNLHLHSTYSALDGVNRTEDYIKIAKEYGHKSMAITDHGNLSGTYEHLRKCAASGIKGIMGCEFYVNNKMGDFEEKKFEGGNSHQIVLVKNKEGYVNINKLAYKSFTEGFYKRGRIKTDWLIEQKEGLFITTSCAISEMALLLKAGKEKEAEDYLKRLVDAFGENIAAEFQFNEYDFQKPYNAWLLKMSKKYNMLRVITNDVHYSDRDGAALQDTLISINQKTQLSDPKAFKLGTRHLYYASVEDLYEFNKKFGFNYPESFIDSCVENTIKVAEKCNFEFDTTTEKYPRYEPSQDIVDYFKTTDTKEIITRLSRAKLKQKIAKYKKTGLVNMTLEKEKEYHDRLTYELEVIDSKNALDYFMVYWDLIRDYKSHGYNIGPGRGCFIPNSKVVMEDNSQKNIQEIRFGDKVLDAYGKSQKVLNTFEYDIKEEIIELEFEDGRKIECTLDHEILTKNRSWVKASELTCDDEIQMID